MAKKPKATRRKSAKSRNTSRRAKRKKQERDLDEGLRETFPASDPPALTDPVRSIKE
jgi:hypothetical protein